MEQENWDSYINELFSQPKQESNPPGNFNKETMFNLLYLGINGYDIAAKEEQLLKQNGRFIREITYGEIIFTSFKSLLEKVSSPPNSVFYDLGSGIGKAVFAAALLGPFERLIGVEIVEQLHITALQVKLVPLVDFHIHSVLFIFHEY